MRSEPSVPQVAPKTWFQTVGPHELRGRVLDESDLPALIHFHHRLLEDLEPGLLNAETDAFFSEHVAAAGRLLGLETDDGKMAAYAVLGLPTASATYNFGRDIKLSDSELGAVAHLDGIGVAARWRGHGLQKAFARRRASIAAEAGRRHMVSTVAPGNLPSLRSLLGLGFAIVATKPMFAAGHVRHLLHLDLMPHRRADMGPPKVLADKRPIAAFVDCAPALMGDGR